MTQTAWNAPRVLVRLNSLAQNLLSTYKQYNMPHDFSSLEAFLESIEMPNSIPDHEILQYSLDKYKDVIIKDDDSILLEFGVFNGFSITKIGNTYPHKRVYGFDSFYGLPEDWTGQFCKGTFTTGGNLPSVPSNVTLIKGLFGDTLPDFAKDHAGKFASLVHIDCDLYSSTKCVFDHLGGTMIRPGTILVFDELFHYVNFKDHEFKALYEFLVEKDYDVEWIGLHGILNKRYDTNPELPGGSQRCACILKDRV